jgi:hypothetical protein
MTILKITGAIVGIVVAIIAAMLIGGVLTIGGAAIDGAVAQHSNQFKEKSILFDPNNSIGRYEQFYDDCRSVVALGEKVRVGGDELQSRTSGYDPKTDTFGDERKAINARRENVRALTNQQIDIAQEYNAASSQTTRSQFKAADLPYTLDSPYAEIECGSPKEAGR